MKKHIGVVLGICLSLTLLSVSSVSSATPQIVGTKCVKAGIIRKAKTVRYECKKSAQGLRWVLTSTKDTPITNTLTTSSKGTTNATTTSTKSTTTTIPLTCATGGTCVVGDVGPGGGFVFYSYNDSYFDTNFNTYKINPKDLYPQWQYLELAPTNAVSLTGVLPVREGGVTWFDAAKTASAYSTPTAEDWFLPDWQQLEIAIHRLYFKEPPRVWGECANSDGVAFQIQSACGMMWTSSTRAAECANSEIISGSYESTPRLPCGQIYSNGFCRSDVMNLVPESYYKGQYAHIAGPTIEVIATDLGNGKFDRVNHTGKYRKVGGLLSQPGCFMDVNGRNAVRAIRGFNAKVVLTSEPVTTVAPSSTATSTTTTSTIVVPLDSVSGITSVNNLLSVQECRIRDATFTKWSDVSSGFPRPDFLRGGFGQLEVLVIPVSFTDLQFSTTDAKAMETTYEKVHSFYSAMSYGQAAVKMTLAPSASWVEVGGTVEQNGLINTPPQWDGSNFYRKVIEIYLRNNTISGYDVVEVVSANTSRRMFGGQAMPSGSNSIYGTRKSFAGTQLFGSNAQNWGIVAHELGHAWLGFEDLYLFEGGSPLGNWDMMSQAGEEFSGWSRFLAGWIDSNWVRCASPRSPSQHYLSSLNADKADQKPRMLVLPLNSQSAVIAELRVPNTWQKLQPDIKNPILVVYRVDTSIDHGKGPIVLVGTANQIGGTISTDGVKITVKGLNSSGVIVDISN